MTTRTNAPQASAAKSSSTPKLGANPSAGKAVPHDVHRRGDLALSVGQPVVELRPRVVGPGRKELRYIERQAGLEADLQQAVERAAVRDQSLELARLMERGAGCCLDKLEAKLVQQRERESRLLVALGAMGQELGGLRSQVALLSSARERPRRSLLARLFGG